MIFLYAFRLIPAVTWTLTFALTLAVLFGTGCTNSADVASDKAGQPVAGQPGSQNVAQPKEFDNSAVPAGDREKADSAKLPAAKLPAAKLVDLDQLRQQIAAAKGKVVVVDLWALW